MIHYHNGNFSNSREYRCVKTRDAYYDYCSGDEMVGENGEYHYIGIYDGQILCGRSIWPHDGYCSPNDHSCPGGAPNDN